MPTEFIIHAYHHCNIILHVETFSSKPIFPFSHFPCEVKALCMTSLSRLWVWSTLFSEKFPKNLASTIALAECDDRINFDVIVFDVCIFGGKRNVSVSK